MTGSDLFCPYCGGKLKSFGEPLISGHTHFCQKCGSLHAPYGLEERICTECGSEGTEEDEHGTWYCEDCYVMAYPPSELTLQDDCYAIAKLLFEILRKHDVQYGTIVVEFESETVSFALEGYNKKFKMEITKTQVQQRDPLYYHKLFRVLRDRGDAPH